MVLACVYLCACHRRERKGWGQEQRAACNEPGDMILYQVFCLFDGFLLDLERQQHADYMIKLGE